QMMGVLADRVRLSYDALAQLNPLAEQPSGSLVQEGHPSPRQAEAPETAIVSSISGRPWKKSGFAAEGRGRRPVQAATGRRQVLGLSQRLLRLLLAHPGLVGEIDEANEQRLATTAGYELVSGVIRLVRQSGAQHT